MIVLPDHRTGTWWDGITLVKVTLSGTPIPLTSATIVMTIKPQTVGKGSITKTNTSGIVITNASAGEFRVDGFEMTLQPGLYAVSIKVTPQDGKPRVVFDADWTITSRW